MVGYYSDFIFNVRKGDIVEIYSKDNSLYCRNIENQIHELFGKEDGYKIYPIGGTAFRIENNPNYITFRIEDGKVTQIEVSRENNPSFEEKVILKEKDISSLKVQILEKVANNESFANAILDILDWESDYPMREFYKQLNNAAIILIEDKKIDKAIRLTEFNNTRYPENIYSYRILDYVYELTKDYDRGMENINNLDKRAGNVPEIQNLVRQRRLYFENKIKEVSL